MDHKAAPTSRAHRVNLTRAQTATVVYATGLLIAAAVPLTAYLPTSNDTPEEVATLTNLQPAAVTNPAGVKLPAGYQRTTTSNHTHIHSTVPPCWALSIPTDPTQAPVIAKKPNLCAKPKR